MDGEMIQRTPAPRAQFQGTQPPQPPVQAPPSGPIGSFAPQPNPQQPYQPPVRPAVPPPVTSTPGTNITTFGGFRPQNPPQGVPPQSTIPLNSQPIRPQPLPPQAQPPLRRLDSQSIIPVQNPAAPYPRPINPQPPGVRPQLPPGQIQRPPNYPPNQPPGSFRPQQPPLQGPLNRAPFPQQQQQQPRPQFVRQPGVQQPIPGPRPAFVGQPPRPIQAPIRQPIIPPGYQQNLTPSTMASEVAKIPENPGQYQSGHNDDDDVVMGRMQTPTFSPVPPVQSRPPSSNFTQNNNPPPTATFGKIPENSSKTPSPQPPQTTFQPQPLQRNENNRSIPSRPPSVIENAKPTIPETNGIAPKPYVNSGGPPSGPVRGDTVVYSVKPGEPAAMSGFRPNNPPTGSFKPQVESQPLSSQSSVEDTTEKGPISKPTPQAHPREPPRPSVVQPQAAMNQGQQQRPPPPQRIERESISAKGRPSVPNNEAPVKRPQLITSGRKASKGDNDSGVDESTQGNERNGPGSPGSPVKSPTKIPGLSRPASTTPSVKSRSTSKSRLSLSDKTPEEPVKKVPMNKIQVGGAPSPNLKAVKSKIGSLENATHKPGGGNVKIETKKVEIRAAPRIAAKNDAYMPRGGDKKIVQNKLQWSAKSKIGSLENAHHKPGGGDKKIESQKIDFNVKAKPKIGSKDLIKHIPGGGDVKIQSHKLDIKAQSKVGSLDNMKHRPGGGDKKIFDDKDYLRNIDHPITPAPSTQTWRSAQLSTSMSLPAECLVMSVMSASSYSMGDSSARKRQRSAKIGRAIHPQPFRNY
ncbi:Microtubule-associated protein [Sergentomyia squamirostris]